MALAVLAVLALLAALPPVRDRAVAAAALAEAVGADVPRPFAAEVERREVRLPSGAAADLYEPSGGGPGLLLVPGAAPAGRDDDRVERLASALARSDLTVLVPELDLYGHRFVESDLDVLTESVLLLDERTQDEDVTVLGISFGGSLALVAAAEPRVRDAVDTVATFGAYADLVGLLQAAATGTSVVDGVRYPWEPPPQAEQALRQLAVELTPREQRDALRSALDSASGGADLPAQARAAYELVTVEDPAEVDHLVADLPPDAKEQLRRFSPSAVADEVTARVLALHSRDDPAVPYPELLRMQHVFPDARTYTVQSFEHVDLDADQGVPTLVGDLFTAWRFAGDVLVAARS